MKLSTTVDFPPAIRSFSYTDQLVFLGSCFAENIGAWLKELQFDTAVNPTGISFNPVSMAGHITAALRGEYIREDALIFRKGQYAHADFHSVFNHSDPEQYLQKVNESLHNLGDHLRKCDILFLTFGTAIAFEMKDKSTVVNNCHKQDSALFNQRFLTESEMFQEMKGAIELVQSVNPEIQIYLTISPVRHLRHGAIDNQRSKARLVRMCEMLCEGLDHCAYIPIYEYVLDELRDYRFYRHDDMIHLNTLGLEMVQDKIRTYYILPSAYPMIDRVEKWIKMNHHRVFDDTSQQGTEILQKRESVQSELFSDLQKLKR